MSDFNASIITEFRENAGKVGGPFEGAPMLLLHTTGKRTGTERVNPLVYWPEGDAMVIFASKGGAPTNPGWYHNLKAHPVVTVETGGEKFQARANVMDGDEYERLYKQHADINPGFWDYRKKTSRKIPVIVLERIDSN